MRLCRAGRVDHGKQVFGFPLALIVCPFRFAHAAKVGTPADITQGKQGAGQGLYDLVVARAAIEGMRMRDQRDPAHGQVTRTIQGDVDATRGASEADDLGMGVHAVRASTVVRPGVNRRS